MKAQDVRNLVALSARKAHLEAVNRIHLSLIQEFASAGVKNTLSDHWKRRFDNALSDLATCLTEADHVISTEFDDLKFNCEDELNTKPVAPVIPVMPDASETSALYTLVYEYESSTGTSRIQRHGTIKNLLEIFHTNVVQCFDNSTLTSVNIYGAANSNAPVAIGFDESLTFLEK